MDPGLNNRPGNNFGLLRLLLSGLVIVSHSPQLIDGNSSREIMTRLFGTITLGSAAVDFFFVLSGYLITKSFVQSPSVSAYFAKRATRILPAFLVSFWICALLVAPRVGGIDPLQSEATMRNLTLSMLRLLPPAVPGTFPGLPYHDLNVSMWTIAYEFRCYIAAATLGVLGLYQHRFRWLFVAGTAALLIANAVGVPPHVMHTGESVVGSFYQDVRFATAFAAGACFYLCRDTVRLTSFGAALSALCMAALLFSPHGAEDGLIVFGGYLMFWFALELRLGRLGGVGQRVDISYGVYLYAWTIQNVLLWLDRGIGPLLLTSVSIPIAALLGYASWMSIEKPALRLLAAKGR